MINKIIVDALAVVVVFLLSKLYEKAVAYINKTIEQIEDDELRETVKALVKSAEQQWKAVNKAGLEKKEYVVHELITKGYEVTSYIEALIESEVFELEGPHER